MVSSRSPRRGGLRVVVFCLALVAFGMGAADVGIFGIHEHETDAATHTSASPDDGGRHVSHHCHLWVNPAEVAPAIEIPTPIPVATLRGERTAEALGRDPLVLFPPPRA